MHTKMCWKRFFRLYGGKREVIGNTINLVVDVVFDANIYNTKYYNTVNRQPVNLYYNFMYCALFWCNTFCICFKCDRNPATWGLI
jgi:hypothetical protein